MTTTRQKLERLVRLLEAEHPVHNRLDLMLLVEDVHLLEPILRSVDNALDCDVPAQRQQVDVRAVLCRIDLPGHVANAVNETTKGDRVEALLEGLRAAGLENDIGSVAVCHAHHFFFPVWLRAVVDGIVGAEGLGLLELSVGGRCDYHYHYSHR